MRNLVVAAAAAAAFVIGAAPIPANALLVDFTNSSAFGGVGPSALTETYAFGGGSLDVTLSSTGTLTFQTFDGVSSVTPDLAFDNDGVGVGDDEITYPDEAVTVSFSKLVSVTGFYFLDLYIAQNGDREVALVYNNGGLVATLLANELFQVNGGYLFAATSPIIANALVFKAGLGNDGVGYPDYALAALRVAPVPLPAALPLFAGGLGVLGLLGRRRKRKAAA